MSGGESLTDPDQLISSAAEIGRCAEALGTELGSLQATVTTGNPWGGDEAGSLFAMAYSGVLNHALDVLSSHADQLFQAADGLAQWADTSARAEEENTQRFREIEPTIGGGAWG